MDQEITLAQMLDARERRAFRQQELLAKYQSALICFTMNIAGPVKNNALIRRGFELGVRRLLDSMSTHGIRCIHQEIIHEITGNEAFFVADADPLLLKRAAQKTGLTPKIHLTWKTGKLPQKRTA